ncbi:MAG: xanthine phosphoribosyltransferase [Haloplasmataceae bacterium]|jgi:xanthine phosphoribosyltransferase|nr:xanthine phosphoribosyltransferase [Haloplasmataceae bacterium]
MELLKRTIIEKGKIIGDDIVKVDAFINHQIDTFLLDQIGKEIKRLFNDKKITKILTIETSGIPFACLAAIHLNYIPVVFAKKQKSAILSDECHTANVFSFTKKQEYQISVDKNYLSTSDQILIIDDFLANGEAAKGLIKVANEAGAHIVGFCSIIEKSFQSGRQNIWSDYPNIEIKSLASIKAIDNNQILFNED